MIGSEAGDGDDTSPGSRPVCDVGGLDDRVGADDRLAQPDHHRTGGPKGVVSEQLMPVNPIPVLLLQRVIAK